jgi:hypothetical protein
VEDLIVGESDAVVVYNEDGVNTFYWFDLTDFVGKVGNGGVGGSADLKLTKVRFTWDSRNEDNDITEEQFGLRTTGKYPIA